MPDMEDFVEPEVGIAIAVTAAVASPKVRKVLRRAAVYALAGVLKAKDVVSDTAGRVAQGARDAAASLRSGEESEAAPAPKKKAKLAAE